MIRSTALRPGLDLSCIWTPHGKMLKLTDQGVRVQTIHGDHIFDFLIISTGLLSDPALRPELQLVESHIARWQDCYEAPPEFQCIA